MLVNGDYKAKIDIYDKRYPYAPAYSRNEKVILKADFVKDYVVYNAYSVY